MFLKKFFKKIKNLSNAIIKAIDKNNNIIGIDLGTANTLICTNSEGIVLNEATCIAYVNEGIQKTKFAYGHSAKNLIGKIPLKIDVINPLENGVVVDDKSTEEMIMNFIEKSIGDRFSNYPILIAGVPVDATNVEKRAIQELLEKCNSKQTFLIYESILDAIGCGYDVNSPNGIMVVDIGGGTTEIAVISLGGIVVSKAFKYAGRHIDNALLEYIKQKYHILIGINEVEKIKKKIGILYLKSNETPKQVNVIGRNLQTHIIENVIISQQDIIIALSEFSNLLIANMKNVLESIPPELIDNIRKTGCYLCGGGSNIKNIDYLLEQTLALKSKTIESPELCVIKGLQKVIANFQAYKHILFQQI